MKAHAFAFGRTDNSYEHEGGSIVDATTGSDVRLRSHIVPSMMMVSIILCT